MRMDIYFGNYYLRGYLQLDLCVGLENSIDSNPNAYAVLTFLCRPHNLRILQQQQKSYSDNHSGRDYKQGTQTVKGLTKRTLEHSPE